MVFYDIIDEHRQLRYHWTGFPTVWEFAPFSSFQHSIINNLGDSVPDFVEIQDPWNCSASTSDRTGPTLSQCGSLLTLRVEMHSSGPGLGLSLLLLDSSLASLRCLSRAQIPYASQIMASLLPYCKISRLVLFVTSMNSVSPPGA